jgi:hypothetical protein
MEIETSYLKYLINNKDKINKVDVESDMNKILKDQHHPFLFGFFVSVLSFGGSSYYNLNTTNKVLIVLTFSAITTLSVYIYNKSSLENKVVNSILSELRKEN